jgi:hypothetical protein
MENRGRLAEEGLQDALSVLKAMRRGDFGNNTIAVAELTRDSRRPPQKLADPLIFDAQDPMRHSRSEVVVVSDKHHPVAGLAQLLNRAG